MAMALPRSAGSNDSGYSTASFHSAVSVELPKTSYDGSHLPWKVFRNQVLAPHGIRVLDTVPKEQLPHVFLDLIEELTKDASRFDNQKAAFRDQVAAGRGFGPSPLFPPNLLPPTDNEGHLARCMIPAFSREALPERLGNNLGPLYELSVPRSGLGCGFAASALDTEEIAVIPSYLCPTGTIVNFESGYISPGAAIYCPFLIFERAYGFKEYRLEAANNQCAIGGAWTVRALQMLYSRAFEGEALPQPKTFSCSIDNTFAIVNMHWIDQNQSYCMSPLCKFDLSRDDHFTKFLIWIEAIGQWAIAHVLPTVKAALQRLRVKEPTPPPTPEDNKHITLSLNTSRCHDDLLIRSLKTTFDDIPWRLEEEECTPVSSSTASWGSPMVTDITFAYPSQPTPSNAKSASSDSTVTMKKRMMVVPTHHQPSPSPSYAQSIELIIQKRLNHALDEIKDLQQQLHVLKTNFHNSTNNTQNELCAVKTTLASVLRKETLMLRNRSISYGPGSGSGLGLNLANKDEVWSTLPSIPASPPPQHVAFESTPSPRPSTPRSSSQPSGRIRSSSHSGSTTTPIPSPLILHESHISPVVAPGTPPSAPLLPSMDSPPPTASTIGDPSTLPPTPSYKPSTNTIPPTPYTPYLTVPPPPPNNNTSGSLVKWSGITLSAHLLATMIPVMSVRVVVLGMVTEAALLTVASPHYASSWEYLAGLFQR